MWLGARTAPQMKVRVKGLRGRRGSPNGGRDRPSGSLALRVTAMPPDSNNSPRAATAPPTPPPPPVPFDRERARVIVCIKLLQVFFYRQAREEAEKLARASGGG